MRIRESCHHDAYPSHPDSCPPFWLADPHRLVLRHYVHSWPLEGELAAVAVVAVGVVAVAAAEVHPLEVHHSRVVAADCVVAPDRLVAVGHAADHPTPAVVDVP